MIGRLLIICFCLLWNGLVSAQEQAYMEVTPAIRSAYTSVAALKMDEARQKIEAIKISDPNNKLVHHIENYVDFFTHFINEDKDAFEDVEDNLDDRLDLIKETKINSPYYLFSQAEMELQWALIRFKFNQKLKGGTAVLRAYNLLEENMKIYPDFPANKKSLSIIHAMAPSVPGIVRKLLGIRGSIDEGTHEILEFVESARENESVFYNESVVIASYILFFLNNDKAGAWDLLKEHKLDIKSNPLLTFIYSNMAQKTGKNDLAIQMLEERIQTPDQLPFYYLDLLLGKNKLYRLDEDADVYLRRYLNQFKGKHFIKEAYQKLAWFELVVHNSSEGYTKYLKRCKKYGASLTDEDKQALKEAKSGKPLDAILLKARLLYDGGYLARAYNILTTEHIHYQEVSKNAEEFNYRLGRVLQGLGNLPEAIDYYDITIRKFKKSNSFFRCNAALQAGLIMEDQGRYQEAIKYLSTCLSIDSESYQESLHQKAKAAIERVETKGLK